MPLEGLAQPQNHARRSTSPGVSAVEAERAIALYNEAAQEHGYTACHARSAARLARLGKRLAEIGGLDAFKRALSAVPFDDFLSGRVRSRDGRPPFRLDLDALLQTDGKMGDVLAKLIDRAGGHGGHSAGRNGKAEIAAALNPEAKWV